MTPLAHCNKCPRIWCKYCPGGAERSGLCRLSRKGCGDSQGTPEVAVPGPSPALGWCQGRVRAGKRQRQLRELPALSTGQKLKLCQAPSSAELGSTGTALGTGGTNAAPQSQAEHPDLGCSSKDTIKCGLHQQGGKSITAVPTLQCAFPLACTFTSN